MGKIDWGGVLIGGFVAGFDVRKMFIGLLVISFFWSPAVLPKESDTVSPIPLFSDPDFHFSQIDTICLAPALDLRSDKTIALALSERGPNTGFFPNEYIPGADAVLAGYFEHIGYGTAQCNLGSTTAADLRTPSDTWLRKLDFGHSNWLFVVAVEDVCTSCDFTVTVGAMRGKGYAIVSGFIFEKRADAVRLVWRDRVAGTPLIFGGEMMGRKGTVQRGEAAMSVDDGIRRLLNEFEWRSGKHPYWVFGVDEENFGAGCDAVWDALNGALRQDAKKYNIAFLDATDRMVLYSAAPHSFGSQAANENHLVLKAQGNACVMQITQSFTINRHRERDDWSDLTKEMRARLAKQ